MKSRSSDGVITLIAVFKLVKGLLLITAAIGLRSLRDAGLSGALTRLAHRVHVDPDGRHLARALEAIANLHGQRLNLVRSGLVLYAALFLIEGVGLLMHRRWAEFFTIAVTTSFVPLEVYELVRRPDGARLALLLVNVAIVGYLAVEIRRRDRELLARA